MLPPNILRFRLCVSTTLVMVIVTSVTSSQLKLDDFVISHVDKCPDGNLGYEMFSSVTFLQCVEECERRPWCMLAIYHRSALFRKITIKHFS